MKKAFSIILVLALVLGCAACSKEEPSKTVVSTKAPEPTEEITVNPGGMLPETTEPAESEKPSPSPTKAPTAAPTETPTAAPTEAPTVAPTETPAPTPEAPKTPGNILLSVFKQNAAGMDVMTLAETLIGNPIIPFMGGAVPSEPGYLNGFGNAEITGFKSAAMFAPMIGTTPFVGYVFELENAGDVPAFISMLKANANLRWNVCTEADEMVTGSVGNKVFFVMSPASFDEE